jgi:RecG-like helicase
MRKSLLAALAVAGLSMTLAFNSRAADEKTVTGEGKCAKCALKETDECQNVVQVKEGDKTVTYYLVQNDISKEFHKNVCKGPKKISVTGTVKEVSGKMELTPTKIDLAKAE